MPSASRREYPLLLLRDPCSGWLLHHPAEIIQLRNGNYRLTDLGSKQFATACRQACPLILAVAHIARFTRSTIRSTLGSTASSSVSAAGSGRCGRGDAHRGAVEVVEGLVGDDGDELGAPAAQARVLLHREEAVRARPPSRGWSACRAAPASARRSPRSRCRARPPVVLPRAAARGTISASARMVASRPGRTILAVPSVSTISPSGTSPFTA